MSDDDGPWKSKSKAIKDYPKQTADGRTTLTEIFPIAVLVRRVFGFWADPAA